LQQTDREGIRAGREAGREGGRRGKDETATRMDRSSTRVAWIHPCAHPHRQDSQPHTPPCDAIVRSKGTYTKKAPIHRRIHTHQHTHTCRQAEQKSRDSSRRRPGQLSMRWVCLRRSRPHCSRRRPRSSRRTPRRSRAGSCTRARGCPPSCTWSASRRSARTRTCTGNHSW